MLKDILPNKGVNRTFGLNMSSESYVGKSYRVTCEEDLLKIPDLVTAREFCKNWGINSRGLRDLKDAIPKLVEHWRENEKRSKEEVKRAVRLEGGGRVKIMGAGTVKA